MYRLSVKVGSDVELVSKLVVGLKGGYSSRSTIFLLDLQSMSSS